MAILDPDLSKKGYKKAALLNKSTPGVWAAYILALAVFLIGLIAYGLINTQSMLVLFLWPGLLLIKAGYYALLVASIAGAVVFSDTRKYLAIGTIAILVLLYFTNLV